MSPEPSSRVAGIATPIIPFMGRLVREHPGTISLGEGLVAFPPPREALARLVERFPDPELHKYQGAEGVPELLDAVARKLAAENGIVIGGDVKVVVTAGGNMAFLTAVLAIGDPGDEFVLLAPYYFNYPMAIELAGCRTVVVPTDERFEPRLDAIEAALTPRTRAVVTISPNNPTGATYAADSLRAVNALCRDRGVYHISDEVYEYFVSSRPHCSPGGLPDAGGHTISIFSLSKAYGMAGWRVGYMTIPATLLDAVIKVQDTNVVCAPVASQVAAAAALAVGPSYQRRFSPGLDHLRRAALERLGSIPRACTVHGADGAIYLFPRIHTSLDPLTVATRLVRDHGVAVLPGDAFGATNGCYVRVAYAAVDEATAIEGLDRLTRGIEAIVIGSARARA